MCVIHSWFNLLCMFSIKVRRKALFSQVVNRTHWQASKWWCGGTNCVFWKIPLFWFKFHMIQRIGGSNLSYFYILIPALLLPVSTEILYWILLHLRIANSTQVFLLGPLRAPDPMVSSLTCTPMIHLSIVVLSQNFRILCYASVSSNIKLS